MDTSTSPGSSSLNRGKVDVFINIKNYNEGAGVPKVDINLAQGYLQCLKEIEEKLNIKNDIYDYTATLS